MRSISFLVHLSIPLMLAVAVAGCGSDSVSSSTNAQIPLLVIPVKRVVAKTVAIPFEYRGQTRGEVDADVPARTEGVILGVHFAEGSEVKEGDLLYTIDSSAIEQKLAQTKSLVAEAQIRLVRASTDLARMAPLAKIDAISKRQLDFVVATEGRAQASLEAAQAQQRGVEIELEYAKVKAPLSGTIGLTNVRVGEYVGKPPYPTVLTTVSRLDPILVRFALTEQDYLWFAKRRIARGEDNTTKQVPLTMTLADGSEYPEQGSLVSTDSKIDTTTGTLTVSISFPNPQKLIRPGQFVTVKANREVREGAVTLPAKSIRDLQGLKQIAVVENDDTIAIRTITAGATVGGEVIIEEGLKDGEVVVLEGQDKLRTGIKISPKYM